MKKPKIICICGSSRFADIIAVQAWELEKKGNIVFSLHLLPEWYWKQTNKKGRSHGAEQEGVADILDELHLRKIDMSDEIFVVNKNGYIGERTRIEIDYAKKLNKPIKYLVPPLLFKVFKGESHGT